MAKSTRFATTVVTRNLMTPQGCDGFYLDGRASGAREARGGDTTLDREDRGFFYAVYSNTGADYKQTAMRNKKYLDKIFEDMKVANRYNIDYEINELADCAVNISGRLTLGDTQQLPPYFSGIVIKDGELAAITSGRGCAYLYRNDLLYPLTKDEYPLSPVDLQGNSVPNLELYCAGLAGTIRYSNIAQLQADDCFMLCNKEVMETIGHHNVLRILEESTDQQDAACRMIDEVTRKNPGITAQVMIGFVENISNLDKAGLKSLTGRMGWTQKTINTPINFADEQGSLGDAAVAGGVAAMGANAFAGSVDAVNNHPQMNTMNTDGYTQLNNGVNQNYNGIDSDLYVQQPSNQMPGNNYGNQGYPDYQNDRILQGVDDEGMSTGKKIAIGVMLVIIVALSLVLAYMLFGDKIPGIGTGSKSTTPPKLTGAPTAINPTNKHHNQTDGSEMFPMVSNSAKSTKKHVTGESKTKSTKEPFVSQPDASKKADDKNSSGTKATTPANNKYTVKSNDSLWSIANEYKGNMDINEYINKVINANLQYATPDKTNLELYPDMELVIPAP